MTSSFYEKIWMKLVSGELGRRVQRKKSPESAKSACLIWLQLTSSLKYEEAAKVKFIFEAVNCEHSLAIASVSQKRDHHLDFN